MKSIAIMQPAFLPWAGYFALMDSVDEFVFLDHVDFDRRSWQQRNQIKTANGTLWLSVPVQNKGKSGQPICDVQIKAGQSDFPDKFIKRIEHAYKKAAFYNDYADDLFAILAAGHTHLAALNMALITYFCKQMGVKTPVLSSSDMNVQGRKAELLANICVRLQAGHYKSPPGAREYIEASQAFADNDVRVSFFDYNHPEYTQLHGDFVPYMSVLDLLLNCGPASRDIMRSGVKV